VNLRTRLTLVAAGVVAVVVVLASLTTYIVMRHELLSQLDASLKSEAAAVQQNPSSEIGPDYAGNLAEVVDVHGVRVGGDPRVQLDAAADRRVLAIVRSSNPDAAFYRDIVVRQNIPGKGSVPVELREYVAPLAPRLYGAVLVVRSLQPNDRALQRLGIILIIVSLGAIILAAIGGALVSRATLAPVRRLTAAAERIAETGEPSERVPVGGKGELARLGATFNSMLGSLEESLETQRRFVADASHELRTPLTSLQTNIDVLRGDIELGPQQRQEVLDDLHRESQEMRSLIGGLLELARGGAQPERRLFQLDELVEDTVERARSRFPSVTWEAPRVEPTVVIGDRDRMERAVWNLLENAGKWSGEGGTVEVKLRGGELSVRDHGPGIDEKDRPLVFDRFYRSAAARSMPGAGLGLSIVREVAELHGGTIAVDNAPGGGARFRLRLNGAAFRGSLST